MKSPLKFHGGKAYLAQWIISLMPPRDSWKHYVEPCFGAGWVLFANNPEGISEAINDISGEIINFWDVLRNAALFTNFHRMIEATPFSEDSFQKARDIPKNASQVERAWAFFVRCRLSMSGRMRSFTPITKSRTRRGMNNDVSGWLTAIEGLPQVHERLKRIVVLGPKDVLEVIVEQDSPHTLFYLDPPYLRETRTATKVYDFEMDEDKHTKLLEVLSGIEGKFLLSGYPSSLYQRFQELMNWNVHTFQIVNHASSADKKRTMTECVWTNY